MMLTVSSSYPPLGELNGMGSRTKILSWARPSLPPKVYFIFAKSRRIPRPSICKRAIMGAIESIIVVLQVRGSILAQNPIKMAKRQNRSRANYGPALKKVNQYFGRGGNEHVVLSKVARRQRGPKIDRCTTRSKKIDYISLTIQNATAFSFIMNMHIKLEDVVGIARQDSKKYVGHEDLLALTLLVVLAIM